MIWTAAIIFLAFKTKELAIDAKYDDEKYNLEMEGWIVVFICITFVSAYILETVTILYFRNMGMKFIKIIMNQHDTRHKRAKLAIESLSLWILICNARFYILSPF